MASCRGLYETVVARVAEDTASFLWQSLAGMHWRKSVRDRRTDRQTRPPTVRSCIFYVVLGE